MTIEEARVDKFPFKENEQVEINWKGYPMERAVITKLHTSIQGGYEVVHGVMVKTETSKKDFSVCASLLRKIDKK